jgi:hypothetical protein
MAKGKKVNPNTSRPLAELLTIEIEDLDGLPTWAISKCRKLGARTSGDLYRMVFRDVPVSGLGPKLNELVIKELTYLTLVDRIGLSDPIMAAACEAALTMGREVERSVPQRLAEHEALVLARLDDAAATTRIFHRQKVMRIVDNFRKREKILTELLVKVTQEEYTFTAPDASPESASRWLALHTAGLVPDGFVTVMELKCTTGSGLELKRKTEIHLNADAVARLLVAYNNREDALVNSPARFAPVGSKVGQNCEGVESTLMAMFVARNGGKLAMLEGIVTVAGMSPGKIKDLFKSSGPEWLD